MSANTVLSRVNVVREELSEWISWARRARLKPFFPE